MRPSEWQRPARRAKIARHFWRSPPSVVGGWDFASPVDRRCPPGSSTDVRRAGRMSVCGEDDGSARIVRRRSSSASASATPGLADDALVDLLQPRGDRVGVVALGGALRGGSQTPALGGVLAQRPHRSRQRPRVAAAEEASGLAVGDRLAGPPSSGAITGRPAAMPSRTTWPKGSGLTEACTSTSSAASSAHTSSRKPRNSTRPSSPRRAASSGSSRS